MIKKGFSFPFSFNLFSSKFYYWRMKKKKDLGLEIVRFQVPSMDSVPY